MVKNGVQFKMESIEIFDNESQALISIFLEKKGRVGNGTMMAYKSAIYRFLSYVGKNNLRDIDRMDSEKYLQYLNNGYNSGKALKLSYKQCQLNLLRSFFEGIEEFYRSKNINYFNPIPKAKFYPFSPDKALSIKEKLDNDENNAYSIDQLLILLKKSNLASYEHFIQCVLLTFCGMRISEVVSIRKENINLKKRYLMTGIEEDCRKSNKNGQNPLIFCFPEIISNLLYDYFQYHELKYPDSKWLFPARNHRNFMATRQLQRFLTSLKLPFYVHSHKFRKTIETFQAYKTNNTPLYIIELLSNHVITSIVYKHYAKCTLEERINFYDSYLPKEYSILIKFLQNI